MKRMNGCVSVIKVLAVAAAVGCAAVGCVPWCRDAEGGVATLPVRIGESITNCQGNAETHAVPSGKTKRGKVEYRMWHIACWKQFAVVTVLTDSAGIVAGLELSPMPNMTFEKACDWVRGLNEIDPKNEWAGQVIFPGDKEPDKKKDTFFIRVVRRELENDWADGWTLRKL